MTNENKIQFVKKRRGRDYLIYTLIIWGGILIDQLSKLLATKFLRPIDTFPIIENVLHFTYLENRGAAFGMLADMPWVFNTISIIAILGMGLFVYLGHASNMVYGVSLTMIISGGIGNMIDRMTLNYVVDFIDCRFIDFAVFNIADSFVCVGAAILFIGLIVDMVQESKRVKAQKAEGANGEAVLEDKNSEMKAETNENDCSFEVSEEKSNVKEQSQEKDK